MKRNDKGFSMMELVISLGIMSLVGVGINSMLQTTNKNVGNLTDDIQQSILRLGAEKFIQKDIVNAAPSYNYLNVLDDTGKWFYAFDKTFLCEEKKCERTITLNLPAGQTSSSKVLYILRVKGRGEEKLVFNIDPETVFSESAPNDYKFINVNISDPDKDISKSASRPYSPCDADRLLLQNSKISIYDCYNGVNSTTSACNFSCNSGENLKC